MSMVVVEFAYEDMRRLVDLPREKMVESLSEMGAPSEYEPELGKIISELTPNRPDWYSMEGLARALRAYHGLGAPEYNAAKSDYRVVVDPSVAKVRPHTACAVVKGLALDDGRIRDMVLLQEKLLATLGRRVKRFGLGIYPLHAIKFPVKYTTMKPGDIKYVPLGHDKEMTADEILGGHKKGEQYGHILKGQPRYPVFVDAEGKVMALIPIVNSAETGKVDEGTRDVFIEVTGTDPHSCKAALNILVCTFADMGGKVFQVAVEHKNGKEHLPDLSPKKVKVDAAEVNRMLGLELGERELAGLLKKMGYVYHKGVAEAPPYRADILGPIDVIEDVAIAYGYNNFRPTTPDFFCPGEVVRRYDDIDSAMRGMGFLEAKTFVLTNKEKLGAVGEVAGAVEISNPNNAEYTVVRPNLLADMLETFRINKMRGLPQRFYELGLVHEKGKTRRKLAFGVMDKKIEFSQFRGFLQRVARERGVEFVLEKRNLKAFEPDISCVVMVRGKEIGILGKVRVDVLERFGIGFDVYICELDV